MRTPHLTVRRGKRVKMILRNGSWFIAKYKERKGRFVHFLNHAKVRTCEIRAMAIVKGMA